VGADPRKDVHHAFTVAARCCRHGEPGDRSPGEGGRGVNIDLLMIIILAALMLASAAYVAGLTKL
jgi:hypothetical protein